MDLFHFEEEAPGAVFWHPNGWKLFQQLIAYMRNQQEQAGYVEVNTPDVMDKGLWEISGHWQNYREHMFTTKTEDERVFALKPMNCPGGVLLYKHGLKSYRDLPIRMAEFGKVHRYEPSGALHGLMRVRHFTQDDAHIFCTPEQLHAECQSVITLVLSIYQQFGFENIAIKLSTRPQNRIGDDVTWDQLEQALSQSLNALDLAYSVNVGEGAFYGPKLEFVLRDAIGRDWQCGTLQVDLNLPERFDLHYINETGERCRPVMLHRALFGSLERFTGILLEHYAGRLPFWLAPVQVVVAPITNEVDDYAQIVVSQLKSAGLRVVLDTRNEKIGYKIREHSAAKVPLFMAVGKREAAENKVSMRWLGSATQDVLLLTEAIEALTKRLNMPQAQDEQYA
jgi:threonyl-tRNA synthetase